MNDTIRMTAPIPKLRVALVQGLLAHYRAAIFRELDTSKKLDVTFFTCGHDFDGIRHLPDGLVHRRRIAPLHELFGLRWQGGIVRLAFSREYDALILMGDPHFLSSWVTAACARLTGRPVLFWTHGWRRRERGIKRLVRLAFYRLASRLLVYGERGAALGDEAGYPARRMRVVYNSLDLDEADRVVTGIEKQNSKQPKPSALFVDPERPLLVCSARLTRQCRFDLLLRAAHRLAEAGTPVNVLLIGEGSMRSELEGLAAELGVDAYFTGAVYDEERLGAWLYHADCTVSPGKVGLTAIHSMMYGTPVITHGDLDDQMPEAETVIPGETGAFFRQGDEAALAKVIADWLGSKRDRKAVRARCRALIHDKWNPHAQARIFEEEVVRAARQTPPPADSAARRLAVVWDNLRPAHDDRLRALSDAGYAVSAIELYGASADYGWHESIDAKYAAVTLARNSRRIGALRLAFRIAMAVRRNRADSVLMCHYERPAVFLAACMLRLRGRRIYTMLDSKFDDYARHWTRTLAKALLFLPYRGALVAANRSRDYAAYLGIPRDRIELGYNSLDLARLRRLAGEDPRPPFAERPFLVVARLVPKKNVAAALYALAQYRADGGKRRLVIVGDGPLAQDLEETARELGIAGAVDWLGARPSTAVMRVMRGALALLVPSLEEQFGHVVLEALALGVPVVVSNNAGAVDLLVDNLVNGYVIDPNRPRELLAAMEALDRNRKLHAQMSQAALDASERGDVRHFVKAVDYLVRN